MKPEDSSGAPLRNLTITRVEDSNVPGLPAPGLTYAGYAYEIEPSGATFDPYLTLTIAVSESEWSALQGGDLVDHVVQPFHISMGSPPHDGG